MPDQFSVVYVTTPRGSQSKKIAHHVLKLRLAACANIIPRVGSWYWWKGKINYSAEAMLVFKTRRALVKKLIQVIRGVHPYDVPEIISLPIGEGNKPYMDWIKSETEI